MADIWCDIPAGGVGAGLRQAAINRSLQVIGIGAVVGGAVARRLPAGLPIDIQNM
jgi:hypothetical protein